MAEQTRATRGAFSAHRFCACVGLILGLILGTVLALTEVTTSVRFEESEGHPKFRVRVLGMVVHRYPEDGELYRMRPGAQAFAVRQNAVLGSAIIVGVIGGFASYCFGCLIRRTHFLRGDGC